jgi:hypothetical protein
LPRVLALAATCLTGSACGSGGGSSLPPSPTAVVDGGSVASAPGSWPADAQPGSLADASLEPTDFEGGHITVPGCGYEVTTRPHASAPRLGEAILGDDPEPVRLHLGLAGAPATSMVVQWATRDQTTRATTLQIGKASTDEHEVEGLTWLYESGADGAGPLVRVHEVHLCDLEPDTTYHYRVGGRGAGGAERWSPTYTFRTAPDAHADPSAEVTALVLGDSRDGYDTLGQLLALGEARATPDVILFTGDAVTHGDDEASWEAFFTAAEPVLRHVPIVFAQGNHEENTVHYFSLVSLPGDEEDFALDYGPLHLVVLNDSPEHDEVITGSTRDFLAADLTAHESAPWTAVMHHRAVYSSAGHGPALDLLAAWAPLYDRHHVDLVLNGHNHVYERSYPLLGGLVQTPPARGTVYVVAAAAGASLYNDHPAPWSAVDESTEHFVVLTIRTGHLALRAYRADGSLLDQLELTK